VWPQAETARAASKIADFEAILASFLMKRRFTA
jgi:hypothetical protein